MLKLAEIRKVLIELKKKYNNTTTALTFKSPFQLLISTMLAAQSTDVQVNKVTKSLFKQNSDAQSFLKLSETELEMKIRTIGLYKSKAKNILATCRILVEKFSGEIPATREELMTLPGVGRKTANVVLSIASDFDAIAVDTHVFRVSNRIGLAEANNVLETEKQLMKNIQQSDWSDAHHWLIWHGRKICKARKPSCEVCFITEVCLHYRSMMLDESRTL
jgi:endonuclease-3